LRRRRARPADHQGSGVTSVGEREIDIVTWSDVHATISELTGIAVSEISHSLAQYAIREDRYKVHHAADQGGFAMYDLQEDPLEEINLYNDPTVAAEQAVLKAELDVLAQAATSGACFQ